MGRHAARTWIAWAPSSTDPRPCLSARTGAIEPWTGQDLPNPDRAAEHGFEQEPPCGRLMPGGLAQAVMPPMPFPPEIRLRWHPAGQPDKLQLTSLNLSNLRPGPGQALELVYADEGWRAELGD